MKACVIMSHLDRDKSEGDSQDLETRHAVALYTLAITVARGGLSLKKG